MGSKEFLAFYLITGVCVGLLTIILQIPTFVVGASGAIYALLLAFATYYPNAKILIFFFFPMKAPYAVLTFAGLSLFFHSDSSGITDLYVSTRPSIVAAWGTPVNLGATVNSVLFDVAPEISSDGLSLYFHSTRAGGLGSHEIWRTTRTRVTNPWSTPVAMPAPVNTAVSDLAPSLSDDWQTLYFASDSGGNRDIWQAVP